MRFVRTATRLNPGQVGQRGRLRAQRLVLRRWPPAGRWLLAGPDPGSASGWPPGFSPLDASLWRDWAGRAELRRGRIPLLGVTRTLALLAPTGLVRWEDADWDQRGEPLLWRFHLHYWDWAWGLTAEPDLTSRRALFAALWNSWRAAVRPGLGTPWLPYPAALRAWTYCALHRDLVAGSEIEAAFTAGLAVHLGFLRRHLETDVGGNHLIKNLKALVGLAVFFSDDALMGRALGLLIRQLARQVLPDGGHYERAPAYHCQVLGDLVDVAGLLQAAGRPPAPELTVAIRRMRQWLAAVLGPDGAVPLLNDGFPVSADLLTAVRPGPAADQRLVVLPDSGLVRAIAGRWHLLADAGLPCPDELPAHAHADTLSCLVHVDGQPVLVDTGTSTYEAGLARDRERSTAAHNTVELDGLNSTEVWGAFRAGRRARVHDAAAYEQAGVLTIAAAHHGYRHLPGRPVHRRRWSLAESGLRIDDDVTGRGWHRVRIRWHFPPGAELRLGTPGAASVVTAAGEFVITVTGTGDPVLTAGAAQLASGFGRRVPAPVLICGIDGELPVTVRTRWQRAGSDQEGT